MPGNISFSKTVKVPANAREEMSIDGIVLNNPELWWPNTYGRQPLYTADVTISAEGTVHHSVSFKFGVREFTYPIDGNRLGIYCNGIRILAKGGNWGMDDGLKMDTPEKYDDKMRLHAEANFTMIRNWVGMTNHRAFYEAADKYGILIWMISGWPILSTVQTRTTKRCFSTMPQIKSGRTGIMPHWRFIAAGMKAARRKPWMTA